MSALSEVTAVRLRAAAAALLGPPRGPRSTRLLRALVLVLLAGHLLVGLGRLAHAGYAKRLREVREWHRLGEVAYQFDRTDAESRRLAAWLCEEVPEGHVVLYTGDQRGYLQLLAALLAPRLLVYAAAVPAGAEAFAGRPIFARWPPWTEPGSTPPVVEGRIDSIRLVEHP